MRSDINHEATPIHREETKTIVVFVTQWRSNIIQLLPHLNKLAGQSTFRVRESVIRRSGRIADDLHRCYNFSNFSFAGSQSGEHAMSVPVDLGSVETTIRRIEAETEWRISLPARIVIQQVFVSFATEEGAFEILMTDEVRSQALEIAHEQLANFLRRTVERSQEMARRSNYTGNEVGLPIVISELNVWTGNGSCHCWPR